jgi:hypothetical protein
MRSFWLIEDIEIKKEVISCIIHLLKNDYVLFETEANERSISHKLAEYLQERFPEWHVDCEYNRDYKNTKKPKKTKELNDEIVYPDIIVHRRNTDYNLLVIELKCSRANNQDDIKKLKGFTDQSGKFRYRLGLFLRITKDGIEMRWFKNGRQL